MSYGNIDGKIEVSPLGECAFGSKKEVRQVLMLEAHMGANRASLSYIQW